ncbi:hypothetical protein [Clostridium celatum]|uniref:hypothetical protein n=1 Tax=Clostridium celatum TaxID=36834 RepID=UPI00189905D8|nr:hypothetical protein [Clostridium celatum]
MPKKITCSKGIFEYLANMYKKFEFVTHKQLHFDFTTTKHIDRRMLGVLGLIFVKLKSKNNEIIIKPSKAIKELLIMSGFFEKFPPQGNIPDNLIPYNTFNGDDNDGYRNYLNKELKEVHEESIVSYLVTHIMEVFLNVRTHARKNSSKTKYNNKEVFSSGYYNKEEDYLLISISNNGKTFNDNIYSKTKIEYINQYEYIIWALKKCHSTTTNRPGGAGLAMLNSLLLQSKGSLIICSGKAYYSISYSENTIKTFTADLKNPYPGTSICIDIPISSFDFISKIDESEEFSIEDLLN